MAGQFWTFRSLSWAWETIESMGLHSSVWSKRQFDATSSGR